MKSFSHNPERKFSSLFFLILLTSCADHLTKGSYYNQDRGITQFQSTKGSQCNLKRQMIVIDDLAGKQFSLITDCDFTNVYKGDCDLFKAGTFKLINEYEAGFYTKSIVYKPIFDSVELITLYPNLDKDYLQSISTTKKAIYPLEKVDSIMIKQMIDYKKDNNCKKEYLQAIKGFYLDTSTRRVDRTKKSKRFMTI